MKRLKTISAVIVTYYPVITDLLDLIDKTLKQVEKIIIVDNTPDTDSFSIENSLPKSERLQCILLGYNSGISSAQNIGLEKSFNQAYEAVLVLDQDSSICEDHVLKLLEGIACLEKDNKIACIGPSVFNRDTDKEYTALFDEGLKIGANYKEVTSIISSGSIILRDAYNETGKMEEDLFIDNVDFEWCWRAKSKGYRTFVSLDVHMGHRVGDRDISIFNLFSLQVPKPIRHYYQFRNTILLMRRSYTPLYFKLRNIVVKPIEMIVFTFFVHPRKERCKMIFMGIIHGLKGKTGELSWE